MKRTLPVLLSMVSPLLADPCCMPLEDPNCYTYAVNPPLVSQPCCVWGGRIDFLYWRPFSEGNEFAKTISSTLSPQALSPSGSFSIALKDYNYDYKAGFRLGVEAGLPCNEWRASLDWAHYLHTTNGSTFTDGPTQVALLTYLNPGSFGFLQAGAVFTQSSVNSSWRIQLDLIDLVLNREFYVGHKVTLSPYGGLRALFLRQKVNGTNNINGFVSGSPGSASSSADVVADFKGVGIVGGFFSSWEVFCNFSLYGDVAASAFYGKSKSSLEGFFTNPGLTPTASTPFTVNFKHDLNTVKALLDVTFGLQWREYLFTSDTLLTIRAGWEEHIFFRQNTLPGFSFDQILFNVNTNKPSSDITFQGLVVSAMLTY